MQIETYCSNLHGISVQFPSNDSNLPLSVQVFSWQRDFSKGSLSMQPLWWETLHRTAQLLNNKLMWQALNYVLQHILLSFQEAARGQSGPVSPWGCSGMLLSPESKERAVIQDCDPETPAKEKGIPQTSVFLISSGHCSMIFVHSAFLLLLSSSCWGKSSRQCQCDVQDFKYPLLTDLKQSQITAWLQRAHLCV